MPRTKINYNKTIIYKLVCNDLNIKDIYVGHTTDFTRRKREHHSICCNENNKNYNLNVYQIIRNNGGWNNWMMLEIEKFECNDANEARTRERYYIELLNANMNIKNPIISNNESKEYQKEWREQNKEYDKKYKEANKDKLKEQQKKYRDDNKDKMKEYKKKYNELNKDNIKKYNELKYRENNFIFH